MLIFDRPGQYVISAGLVVDLPLTAEPSDREGVATLTMRCLDEGTRTHPGTRFSEVLEDAGAAMAGSVGHSASELYLDVPAHRLGSALELMAQALIEPALETEDVDRHRSLRLAQIEQTMAHPAQRVGLAFREAVLESGYRAARPAGGTAATVARVSADDVRSFHAQHYSPANSVLVLAGDFTDDPFDQAEATFGRWRSPENPTVHETPRPAPATCLLIDRPDAVQADVRLGGFGIDRTDPRWADVQVASYALGGAFLSRLNRVLREERGYTYGVQLVNQPMRSGGLLTVAGSFRTEVAGAAISEAVRILDLERTPITENEVADAVNYAVGVTPLRYATAAGITEQVTTLIGAGLSSRYVDSHTAALGLVTPGSATRALRQVLDPTRMSLLVVGSAKALEGPLRDAGWAVRVQTDAAAT
ncbi:MAG: insulinase family protein [Micropruina sp.]|nr:insulinase family protein [Micropruina sp.]